MASIGALIGFHHSTVWREVSDNCGVELYAPIAAHRAACSQRERPKASTLATNLQLCAVVVEGLQKLWSPEQIAAALRRPSQRLGDVGVERTIYKSLYVQGRGELRHVPSHWPCCPQAPRPGRP